MGSYNDNFDRADQLLTASPNWPAAVLESARIVGNQLTNVNSGVGHDSLNYWAQRGHGSYQFTQGTIITAHANAEYLLYLRMQLSGPLQKWNCYRMEFDDGGCTIEYIDGSGAINGLVNSIGIIPVVNDVMKFEANGSTLTVYRNGISVLSVADMHLTDGYFGLGLVSFSPDVPQIWDQWCGGDGISVCAGVFSKDRVLYVGSFDAGIIPNYGLFDDDFVDQSDGTTVGATATGMGIVSPGVFDRRQTLMGLYGAV